MSEIKKVKVMNKSGFDKSHRNLCTTKVGTLTPVLVDELIPNTTIHLKDVVSASLPPLASDTFMSCDLELNAFFVPSRLCYKGFEKWVTGQKLSSNVYASNINLYCTGSQVATNFGPGSLGDYLGIKLTSDDVTAMATSYSGDSVTFNIYPFLAYHRIWDDWYRNPLITTPLFREPIHGSVSSNLNTLPYEMFTSTGSDVTNAIGVTKLFSDGSKITDLRQRNFGSDYFTICTPQAQAGPDVTVSVTGNSFTISQLRQQNALQQYLERNNICGPKYQDWLKGQYGADLNDGVAQRTLYLGSSRINVYSKGVNQTVSSDGSSTFNNPFDSVASQFGQAVCNGNSTLVDSFTAQEHGYLMVIASLVPRVTYGSGVNRMMRHYSRAAGTRADMANPLLQNVGQQPVYVGELNAVDYAHQPNNVFGYNDRYSEYMDMNDEIHGKLRDGEDLEAFALQRNFTNGQAQINTNFLEIPTTYLDQVAAVTGDISQYGCWMDMYFDYKVSMPLAKYCIPSLQDPAAEHGHEITLKPGGSRID